MQASWPGLLAWPPGSAAEPGETGYVTRTFSPNVSSFSPRSETSRLHTDYSPRSVSIGSTDAARRAGM